jgi:hypothetical protein
MAREVLLAFIGGIVGGLFQTAALSGTVGGLIFAMLAEVPLFLVGLSVGLLATLIAAGVSIVMIGLVGGPLASLLFLITTAGPLIVMVRQSLLNRQTSDGVVEWYPPGLLIAWLTGMAAGGIALSAFLLADFPDGLSGEVRSLLAREIPRALPNGFDPKTTEQLVDQFTAVGPGVVAVSWVLMMAVNGILAQGLLVGLGRNLRPSPPIATLDVPSWVYYAFSAAVLTAIVADNSLGYIARNLAIAFSVPFFFQGLAVVHALINRLKAWRASLFIFYLILIVAGWPAIFVTAIGLAEPFLKVRFRYGRPRGSEET